MGFRNFHIFLSQENLIARVLLIQHHSPSENDYKFVMKISKTHFFQEHPVVLSMLTAAVEIPMWLFLNLMLIESLWISALGKLFG